MKMYPLKYKGKKIAENGRHPFKSVFMDLWYGLVTYKYPVCCVLQFCWEILHSEPPSYKREQEQENYDPEDKWHDYVPCNKCLKEKKL